MTWKDLISGLGPDTLPVLTRLMVVECVSLLTQLGIHLDSNRERMQVETTIDVLYRKEHIQATKDKMANEQAATKQRMGNEKEKGEDPTTDKKN